VELTAEGVGEGILENVGRAGQATLIPACEAKKKKKKPVFSLGPQSFGER
jgi:hypothetical protein